MPLDPPSPRLKPTSAASVGGAPLRVATVGMNARQITVLEMAFQGPCADACVLVEEQEAHACIVDMDSYGARDALRELRERHPQRPLILLSLTPPEAEVVGPDLVLAKPIKLDELVARLAVLRERLIEAPAAAAAAAEVPPQKVGWGRPAVAENPAARVRAAQLLDQEQAHALVGTAPDIDPRDPDQLAKAYYDPSRFLQTLIVQARNSAAARGQAVRILGPWPEIVLDPARELAYVAAADGRLRPYCLQPELLHQGRLEYIDRSLVSREESATIGLDTLIWKVALWASRGRLPQGTPVDAPVALSRWPNFPRLLLAPGAMSIAALWSHEPQTLIQTAEALKLPQRSVFSFYSGAAALGLVHCQARGSAVAHRRPPTEPSASRPRGLIGRIVKRLHLHF